MWGFYVWFYLGYRVFRVGGVNLLVRGFGLVYFFLVGVTWIMFDELVSLTTLVLGVVMDVGFSVWVVSIFSVLVLEEKGWVKFIDF